MRTERGHGPAPVDEFGQARAGPATPSVSSSVAGEPETIEGLFDSHYVSLVRLAAAVLRDPFWAEDVVQDCFARLQVRWASLHDSGRALAYLRQSVINTALTELRRRRVRSVVVVERESVVPRAEDVALSALRNSELLEAVALLPRRQREVTLLRFLNELSIVETAAVLGISPGAVTASQNRALGALRKRLGGL